jgi:hypothetical protein
MKKATYGAALVLAVGYASLFLANAKSEGPKAAPSASQAVVSQWNEIGRKLIAMAEDFPEDKYDFKPAPAQRTFAEQLLHVSASMYYFTDPAQGQKPRYPDDPKREGLKTKAEVVAFVKKCVERQSRRQHQAFLRAGHGHVHPPFVVAVVDRCQR